jgi:anaerobic selenocysteine-containing dehydrogenase
MKDQLEALLEKDMDRRDFLKHVAIGFAALTGVAGLLKTLNTMGKPAEQFGGYGASAYGGGAKPNKR